MPPDEILQRFHDLLHDLNTRLAAVQQSAPHLTTPMLRKALLTMLVDHARQCLDLALSEESSP